MDGRDQDGQHAEHAEAQPQDPSTPHGDPLSAAPPAPLGDDHAVPDEPPRPHGDPADAELHRPPSPPS